MIGKYFLFLAGFSLAAFAQTSGQGVSTPAHKATIALSADIELVMSTRTLSGTTQQTTIGKYCRSTDGRSREDMGSSSLITDGNGTVTILYHNAKQATVSTPLSRPVVQQPAVPPADIPKPESVSLGTGTFESYQATGVRLTTTIHLPHAVGVAITEIWTIPELGLPVSTKSTTPQGENTQRYRNIAVGEPDAALFAVPADYTVKYVTGGASFPQELRQ